MAKTTKISKPVKKPKALKAEERIKRLTKGVKPAPIVDGVVKGTPQKTKKAAIQQLLATVSMGVLAEGNMLEYGIHTIEERAIACLYDGAKPVVRRAMYGMYESRLPYTVAHKKSAKVVGEVMGNYHPHGDSSIYGAMVRVSNGNGSCLPLIDGQGNWGDYSGSAPSYGAAAMRYTECRLTEFATKCLLPSDYMDDEVIPYVPNYDGTTREPVFLPSLLPHAFMQGCYGIATGVAVAMPPYTLDSVIAATKVLYETGSGKKAARKLIPTSRWGAKCMATQEGLDHYHATGAGRFIWKAPYTVKEIKSGWLVSVTGLPIGTQGGFESWKGGQVNKKTGKVSGLIGIPGVWRVDDVSARGELLIEIECRTEEALVAVEKRMSMAETYRAMTTLRDKSPTDPDKHVTTFLATSPIHMLEMWLEWRVALEKRLLMSLIRKNDAESKRLSLMIIAASNLDKLVVIIKAKSGDKVAMIEKALKVNHEDAKTIWGLTVSRLDTVNIVEVKQRIEALAKDTKRYRSEFQTPHPRLLAGLVNMKLSPQMSATAAFANAKIKAARK